MAPLSPDNTPRFRVFYDMAGDQHSFQIRSHASPATVGGIVDNFLSNMGIAGYLKTILFVDFAVAGSSVYNPVTTGIEGNTYGSGLAPAEAQAWEFNFIGRTVGGRRVRIGVFGATALGDNYRYIAGESGQLDSAIAALVAAAGNIVGIDDLTPVWKDYVNVKPNDHWVKNLRG
jgi:hypothetical protein